MRLDFGSGTGRTHRIKRLRAALDVPVAPHSDGLQVMAVVQTAMLAGLPYTGLCDAILTHLTMAEGLGALFANVPPKLMQWRTYA